MKTLAEFLIPILEGTTVIMRKGEVVKESKAGPVDVTTIDAFPSAEEVDTSSLTVVDCHFISIGVDKAKAETHRSDFVEMLAAYEKQSPGRLRGGPSYIEVGAEIGDQTLAFGLFAVGEALDLWKVVTPARLGMQGPLADQMAGRGFVMMSGYVTDGPVQP
jgi:hypothetical protein